MVFINPNSIVNQKNRAIARMMLFSLSSRSCSLLIPDTNSAAV